MKTGVVDVGGGLRGIYGAGVFDWCMESGITFDYNIGVSAGSANIASFLAGQQGRNYKFYTEYSTRKEYMGFEDFLKTGNFVNLEYIYGYALSNSSGEYPLDYEAMVNSGRTMKVVATDAITGKPVCFDLSDMSQDDYGAIKASSCVPVVNRPYEWKGRRYFDGGLSDPIPFQKAFDWGCDKVVVVLTRPKHGFRQPSKDARAARILRHRYPKPAYDLEHRAETYNRELREALKLQREGKVLVVAPTDIGKLKTLNRDFSDLDKLYCSGYQDAQAINKFLED